MKISRNSWHYRFNTHVQGVNFPYRMRNNVVTTCDYIRTTLFSLAAEAVILLFTAVVASACIFAVLCMTVGLIAPLLGFFIPADVIVVGISMWAAIGITILVGVFFALVETSSQAYTAYKHRRQDLLRQSLEDYKNGICTIVTVED